MMANFKSLFLLLGFTAVLVKARVLKNEEVHNLLSDDEVEKVFGTKRNKVPEYDVVHPVLLDDQGDFLSHDVTHNDKREAPKNLHFGLSAFGKRYHLDMKLNTDQLLAPGFVTEIRNNGESRYDRSIDDCHYLGHLVTGQGPGDKVALSNCDGLTGMIQSKREVLMISPLPKRLGLTTPTHVIYKRSHGDAANLGRQLGIDVRSMPLSLKNQEPSNDDDDQEDDVYSRPYYIEALVVTDTNMLKYHGNARLLKSYVLTLMNIVHSLIGDPSIGASIKYVLNKLQILETYEPGFYVNSHAERTLTRFCKWTNGQKTSLKDSDNSFFDNAVLISRTPFCAKSYNPKSSSCQSLLGLADLEGMCGYGTSCVLNTDTGLGTAFTIAHETGHNLGAEHDGEGNNCPDAVNIMARTASGKPTGYQWSRCSRDYILKYLRGGRSSCLKDTPGQSVKIPAKLPGQDYSLDDQCKLMIKGSTGFCNNPDYLKIACSILWCVKGSQCHTIREPAAEGSKCGHEKFCRRGMCVDKSAFGKNGPKPVNGGFSAWSGWGKCSHTCGGGVMVRTRQCDNPKPKNFGKPCMGEYKDFKYCVNKKCPSSATDPRMKACISKRNIRFSGNQFYDWVYNPKGQAAAKARCKLTCEAPASGSSYTFYTFGAVENGLRCDGKGPKGVCVNGACKELGCDNVIGSKAKLDKCGVCNGDGSGCSSRTVSNAYNKVPDYNGPEYQTITTIPAGAEGIYIKELSNSKNYLALETTSKTPILNMDYYVSDGSETLNAAGTTFVYTQNGNIETITAKGPLTQGIIVKFLLDYSDYDYYYPNYNPPKYHVVYKYSLVSKSTSSDDISKDDSAEQFRWKTTAQRCSATCGGGKRLVTVECVRVDDGSPVSHDKCESEAPEGLSEECNTQACPPRWSVKDWQDCSKTCNDGSLGQQSREVMCVMQSNGEEEILDDSDCEEPKPKTVQSCGHEECPAEWVIVKTSPCSATCGRGIINFTTVCQKTDTKGQKRKVPNAECPSDDKPPATLSCNTYIPCQ